MVIPGRAVDSNKRPRRAVSDLYRWDGRMDTRSVADLTSGHTGRDHFINECSRKRAVKVLQILTLKRAVLVLINEQIYESRNPACKYRWGRTRSCVFVDVFTAVIAAAAVIFANVVPEFAAAVVAVIAVDHLNFFYLVYQLLIVEKRRMTGKPSSSTSVHFTSVSSEGFFQGV